MIRLEGVTRRYRSAAGDRTALDAVDLHVARGEVFGVVGRSGAGKSCLLSLCDLIYVALRQVSDIWRCLCN